MFSFGALLTETTLIKKNIIPILQIKIGKTTINDTTKNSHQKVPNSADVISIARAGIIIKIAAGINKPIITILPFLSFSRFTTLFSLVVSPGHFNLVTNTAPQEMQCC